MSNYESTPSRRMISEEDRKLIDEFFGNPERVGAGSSCPRCGASVNWNYINGKDMLLHIKWHENLVTSICHGAPYPGMRI